MTTEEQLDFIDPQKNENYVEIKQSNIDRTFLRYRLIKTFFLFLSWICLGLFSEILGPALPSLRILTNSNYEEIGRALSARAAGLLIGSIIGGFLSDRFLHNRSFLVFIFLSIAGITVATIPLCYTLVTLSFNLFISGFSHGAFTTAGNPLLGSLWKKSTGPYNFMHSGYGLGAAVAPLLLTLLDTSVKYTYTNITQPYGNNTTVLIPQNIQPSFTAVGIICIIVGLIFLIYCFILNPLDELEKLFFKKRRSVNISKEIKTKREEETQQMFIIKMITSLKSYCKYLDQRMILIMVLCFISYFGIVGNERVFGKFQFSYATQGPLQISLNKGYLINCLYWVSFCVARIVMAIIAIKVQPKILLIIEICGAVTSSLVFTIWNNSQVIFFIFSTCFGFFKSPLFPTMLGVLNMYTPISGVLVILVNLGSAAGAMSCQYLAGYLIEYYGHFTFPITVTSTGFLLVLLFVVMLIVTRKWKKI